MKSLTETYTPQIKTLQALNLEIRQRLSSMHSCTEQEMQSLGLWLEEVELLVKDLDNVSLIISHHSRLLRDEYREKLKADSLKH